MNKRKIKEIVKFSIKQNIQNKWFIIFNVLLLILLLLITNAKNINQFLEDNNIKLFNDEITIEYIDNDKILGKSLEENFKDFEKVTVKKVNKNEYNKENIKENLIVIEAFKDEEELVKAKITSKEGIDNSIYNEIIEILKETRIKEFSKNNQIEIEKIEALNKEISIERVLLGVDAENSDQKEMIQYISTIIVYMISIFIFSKIANEIANEKVSKSIEYVLTTVTAKEYLLAKIISVISVVLIQTVFVAVYYMIGNLLNSLILLASGTDWENNAKIVSVALDKDIIAYICVVFVYSLLTLVLLSIIQAALSSKTTSMSEAGNSMTFLMVITISVYMVTLTLINPYTNMNLIIYILSCIPLISNYFIPAIMIIGQAKIWQIVISLLLLIISIPITFNFCSKVFKNGVLDYSNKKTRKRKQKKELTLKEEQTLKLEKYKFRTVALAIGMSIILYFVMQIISQLVLETLLSSLLKDILTEDQVQLILMGVTSILSLTIPYGFLCLYSNKAKTEVKTEDEENVKMLFIAVFFTGIVQIFLILLQTFGLDNRAVEEILDIQGLDNLFTQILFILTIAVLPGIFEELLFRKGIINLTKKFGDKFAIFISALAFGVCHLNVTQGIFAFFMGIILGTLYVKTGNMKYNMLLHALNNSYAAIITILAYCELDLLILFVTSVVILFIALGEVITIKEIIKRVKAKQKLIDIKGKLFPENVKYMFTDFTFIISTTLMILAFIVTENVLKLL